MCCAHSYQNTIKHGKLSNRFYKEWLFWNSVRVPQFTERTLICCLSHCSCLLFNYNSRLIKFLMTGSRRFICISIIVLKMLQFFISSLIIVHMHCFSVLAAYFAFHCFIGVHRLDMVQAMTQLYILPSWQFGHCFYDNEWNAQVASVWLITAAIVDGYSCWW